MEHQNRPWYEVGEAPGEPAGGGTILDRLREGPGLIVVALVLGLAVCTAGFWLASSAASGPRVDLGALPAASGDDVAEAAVELVVDVGGAVRSPGLYRLPAGSRVGDAIAAAGGFGPDVDAAGAAERLNLAAVLSDGQKIVVPMRGAPSPAVAPGGGGGGTVGSLLIDLNHASQSELESLPGIGPVTAGKIIAARTEQRFARAEELLERKIVGKATWEKIRDLVTAG